MSNQLKANLRVCARCEWVFKDCDNTCPQCDFVSYGARYVYGNRAYVYARTQKPWKEKKLLELELKLNAEIALINIKHKKSKVLLRGGEM